MRLSEATFTDLLPCLVAHHLVDERLPCLLPIQILNSMLAIAPLRNNPNSLCRHIGHCPLAESCFIHSEIQCFQGVSTFNLHNRIVSSNTDHVEVVATFARY